MNLRKLNNPRDSGKTYTTQTQNQKKQIFKTNAILNKTNTFTCSCGDIITVYEAHAHTTTCTQYTK